MKSKRPKTYRQYKIGCFVRNKFKHKRCRSGVIGWEIFDRVWLGQVTAVKGKKVYVKTIYPMFWEVNFPKPISFLVDKPKLTCITPATKKEVERLSELYALAATADSVVKFFARLFWEDIYDIKQKRNKAEAELKKSSLTRKLIG